MKQPCSKRLWQCVDWKKVEHSKGKIKVAGSAISKKDYSKISEEEALSVVNNWRAAHAFPLQIFYMNCKQKSARYKNSIAVQRLKRLDSIIGKLTRQPDMSLIRMQDLGGCRMIMDSITDVYKVVDEFKKSRIRHELLRENDYISNPKKSGYRCVHLVYRYNSDKKDDYNGMFVEVQIRTNLQHLWATAIEVLGLYTKHNMKASQGDTGMLRYMELVSALFAIEEGTALSENVPQSKADILVELHSLDYLNVLGILTAMKKALIKKDDIPRSYRDGYYILSMNHDLQTLQLLLFKKSEISFATEIYEETEIIDHSENVTSVLVSASNMDALKKAYPNYFVDVDAFVDMVKSLI